MLLGKFTSTQYDQTFIPNLANLSLSIYIYIYIYMQFVILVILLRFSKYLETYPWM